MDNSWILAEWRWRQGFERELLLCSVFSLSHTHAYTHTHTHIHSYPCPWRRCGGPCTLPQNGKDFTDTVWRAWHVPCVVGRHRRLVSNPPQKTLRAGDRLAGWLLMYLPRIHDCFEWPTSQSHLGWNASVWPLARKWMMKEKSFRVGISGSCREFLQA